MIAAEVPHSVVFVEAQRAASSTAKCMLPIANNISARLGMPTSSMAMSGAMMANSIAVVPRSLFAHRLILQNRVVIAFSP